MFCVTFKEDMSNTVVKRAYVAHSFFVTCFFVLFWFFFFALQLIFAMLWAQTAEPKDQTREQAY